MSFCDCFSLMQPTTPKTQKNLSLLLGRGGCWAPKILASPRAGMGACFAAVRLQLVQQAGPTGFQAVGFRVVLVRLPGGVWTTEKGRFIGRKNSTTCFHAMHEMTVTQPLHVIEPGRRRHVLTGNRLFGGPSRGGIHLAEAVRRL